MNEVNFLNLITERPRAKHSIFIFFDSYYLLSLILWFDRVLWFAGVTRPPVELTDFRCLWGIGDIVPEDLWISIFIK